MNYTVEGGISLDKVPQIQSTNIMVPGWIGPLEIHYGTYNVGAAQYILWKIAGTSHTFKVPSKIVFQHHSMDVKEHFILTLKQFRTDYIEWMRDGFSEDWQQRYYDIFNGYILTKNIY